METTFFDNGQPGTDLSDRAALLRTLIDISIDAVVVVDHNGRFRYTNPAHERLTGYTDTEIVGRSFVELIHPDERPLAAEQFAALVRNPQQTMALETRVLHRDGSIRYVEASGKALPNGDFAGYLRDVTERRRATAALHESDANFRILAEISVDGIVIVRPDTILDYANAPYLRVLGYAYDEVVGHSFIPFVHPDDLDHVQTKIAQLLQNPGQSTTAELRVRHKDGSWRILEGVGKLMPNGNIVAYVRDITDRREADEQLRASEEQFRSLIENSSDGIMIFDRQGTFGYISPGLTRIVGWEASELLGQAWHTFAHQDDLARTRACFHQVFEHPGQAIVHESRFRHKDGSWHLLEVVAKLHPNGRVVANSRDITERKQAEEQLRDSEERFRAFVEVSPVGIVLVSPEGNIRYASPAYARFSGYEPEDLVGQSFLSLVHPDEMSRVATLFAEVLHNSDRIILAEYQHLRKDSVLRIAEATGKVLPNGDIVGFVRDITEHKRTEEALRLAERRYHAMFDQPLLSVQVFAADGRVLQWNEAYAQLWDVNTPEHIERLKHYNVLGDQALVPFDVAALADKVLIGEAASIPPTYYCPPVYGGEGRARWVQGFVYPVKDDAGVAQEVITLTQDITAQKAAEDQLRQLNEELEQRVAERTAQLEAAFAERARLAEILEATSDMVAFATLDGQMLYVNQAGRRMVGIPTDLDVNALSFADFYPPDVLETFTTVAFPTALRDGTWSGEVTLKHWDGHIIPASIVGIVHFGPDGTPTHLSSIIRDISQQKQVEAELRQAKEAAEAANKAKSTFLANMSHEIRTPMNAVIGMTSLLLNTALNEKQHDFVETIRTSGDALLTIINDILDFSKIEAGKLDLERQSLDVRSCIESALDLLAPNAAEKGVDLAYELGDEVPGGIVGDVTRLRQILVNLLSNAIKFTERGEVVVSVSSQQSAVSSQQSSAKDELPTANWRLPTEYELHFTVKDTGIGLPPDKLGRLFQSFSQLDASTTREYGGTGLGLAISKRLAELMGGRMWAESRGVGQGATFHFTIRAETAPAPVRVHLHRHQPLLAGKRLLVVDDHPTNRRILGLQAQTWGMECVTAASPQAALALLGQGKRFDLAVLDMHMPEMDGAALAAAMCAEHARQGQHFPLILLTSLGYETRPELESVECFAAYLTKPVKPSQLYDVLISVLAAEEPATHRPQASATASMLTQLATRLPLRILLAEDVAVNQKFALLALEDLGYSADVAANGHEVLAAIQRQVYDVILMDVQMPELDGLEATRRIRREFGAERQPHIIAMTANAMQGDRELCLEAGMDDYVSKPVYLDELRAALERVGQRTEVLEPALLDQAIVAQVLRQRMGHELIALYVAEAEQLLAELASAVALTDLAEAQRVAHGLKSSSRYVGARGMAELSEELEALARDGALAQALPMVKELQRVFERTRERLLSQSRVP